MTGSTYNEDISKLDFLTSKIIHGGPTTGKSHIVETNPDVRIIDTDDIIRAVDRTYFDRKPWRSRTAEDKKDMEHLNHMVGLIVRYLISHNEVDLITTNLWGPTFREAVGPDILGDDLRIEQSFFRRPEDIYVASINRGGSVIDLDLAKRWFDDWQTADCFRNKYILRKDSYLSDLVKFHRPAQG